jgi:cbb3-type cytochrome oxidase maturation protein
MSVIFIALPIALLFALSAVIAFVYAVREGQYDDLETPPRRMLFDDVPVKRPEPSTSPLSGPRSGNSSNSTT